MEDGKVTIRFRNRREAGKQLAEHLRSYADREDVVVLGLPRGGIPVAFEVASALGAPLDSFAVRKLGVPGQEELAFGAIATGKIRVLNESLVRGLRLTDPVIERITAREQEELDRREAAYRDHRPQFDLRGKTVIVVDDGLATGATMRAAVSALKTRQTKEIVVAVPVGSADTCEDIGRTVDVVCVCAATPEPFYGVGMWYDDFSQTTDSEVRELLARSDAEIGRAAMAE